MNKEIKNKKETIMKPYGQIALGGILFTLVAISVTILVFTNIRKPGGEWLTGLSPTVAREIRTTEESRRLDLERELGIDLDGLDMVLVTYTEYFSLVYNFEKNFVVTIPDASREAEARAAVADWFKSKGVDDLGTVSIIWRILP